MKILRLLNNNNFSNLLLIFFLCLPAFAENEPVDIWNIDQNKIQKNKSVNNQNNQKSGENQISQSSIYDLQSQKEIDKVQMDSSINSKKVKIIGPVTISSKKNLVDLVATKSVKEFIK